MTTEPLSYRARKWAVQRISTLVDRSDQHERLNDIEWDVLVILDACRFDTLKSVTSWPIDHARSPASATDSWLEHSTKSGILTGANVATANVKYEFADIGATNVAKLWETEWDARVGTVLPEPVLDRADEFLECEDRPVVAHLLPPHAPYVGKVGHEWLSTFPDTVAWDQSPHPENSDRVSAQVAMASGYIDLKRAKQAYQAAVESTWNSVAPYIGKWVESGHEVILTADHGETFGEITEYGLYGHPNGCHVNPLVKVPFERFRPRTEQKPGELTVEQKLHALGYVE